MSQLVVVGTGIHIGQLSTEAREWLECADKVLYCVSDPASERVLLTLNGAAESLYGHYGDGKDRIDTYADMTARILACLDQYDTVVAAFDGHPGFFVAPSHQAVRLARQRGHDAKMLPAVSSFDCLVSDLGIDAGAGCQIFEATDLMIRQRRIDVASHLMILQVAALGDVQFNDDGSEQRHLDSLRDYLLTYYPSEFEVTLYFAAQFSMSEPRIESVRLCDLTLERIQSVDTLYLPPIRTSAIHLTRLKQYDLVDYMTGGRRLVPINAMTDDERL